MAVVDILSVETGNGGDMLLKGRDLGAAFGWENMVYLAMFGGNVGFPTPRTRPNGEQAFDWWGNGVIAPNDITVQFNSLTENALNTIALTSSGRVLIEDAVKKDLAFMSAFANLAISVTITGVDRLQIAIRIARPDNLQSEELIYLWDGVDGSLTLQDAPLIGDFNNDFSLDFYS
jgi:hypothetical protein